MRLPYHSRNKATGITHYETGPNWIKLTWQNGTVTKYTEKSAGKAKIQQMKRMAQSGRGLHAFVRVKQPKEEE